MPTLETIEVPVEPSKPKQSKQAGKVSPKARNVTPPTESKPSTQPKQPKQLGLAHFFAKVPKENPPPHETPTLDPARRSALVDIVVGRVKSSNNALDPTKKLDFDKKREPVERPSSSQTNANEASLKSPASKKQKRSHSVEDESHAITDSNQSQEIVQTTSPHPVVEKIQTIGNGSPKVSLPEDKPIADKKSSTNAAEDGHRLEPKNSDDAVQPSSSPETADVKVQKKVSPLKITSFLSKSSPTGVKSPNNAVSKTMSENPPTKDDTGKSTPQFYSVGDRLEVLWTIQSSSDEDQIEQRWWSATLCEDNGETMVLEYDPYPEGGFDKVSRETITLTSRHTLSCNGDVMYVRREGEEWTNESGKKDDGENDKRQNMLRKYTDRAKELLTAFKENLSSEPQLNIVLPVEVVDVNAESNGFPDYAIKTLTALIEGRSEPLGVLACIASEQLTQTYNKEFSLEETSSKIKVIATRKNVLKDTSIVTGESCTTPVDLFEDESPFWRWEVTVVDLLPSDSLARVKKARGSHKKISSHWNAIVKLIKSLQNRVLNDKAWAKISQDEEKFLKYEREEEKARLAMQAKASKQQEKEKEKLMKKDQIASQKKAEDEEKRLEKAKQQEEKMLLKKEAAAEKQRKKDEAEKIRRQKEAQKQEAEREKKRKQQLLAKQQSRLLSIFVPKKKEVPAPDQDKGADSLAEKLVDPTGAEVDGAKFDAKAFHSEIATGPSSNLNKPFKKLSNQALLSRKSQTRRVTVPVDVTVYPDDPFASEPYAERQDVEVLNKYKFFLFHEDVRPPYYGTWSKPSKIVTGRTPFKQDKEFLDYDYDSEAEWEEGDDEFGDECDEAACAEEEDKDEENDIEDEDGWLAADDEIPEDLDEETKERLRKQYEAKKKEVTGELTVCIIAPVDGKPFTFDCDGELSPNVEGFSLSDAADIMKTHIAETIEQNIELCLDPFPPSLIDEPSPDSPEGNQSKEMSLEDQKTFVQFVHNSTIGSKDKLIDELRSLHPQVTSSRAQAIRALGMLAEKIKSPSGASCWRVKSSVLSQLDLAHLADTKIASESQEENVMKIVARLIHHETFASKEKAVDELRLKSEELKATSRAECLRILDAVATKKKSSGSGFYWAVNDDIQSRLALTDLPKDAPSTNDSPSPKVCSDDLKNTLPIQSNEERKQKSPPVNVTEGKTIDSAQKKRKTSSSGVSGSSKLMESFLKRAKAS